MSEYQKYCYWVSPQARESVQQDLEKKEVPTSEETHIPCRILRSKGEGGWVFPQAWSGVCKRRCSWYWASAKADMFLIVSNGPLDFSGLTEPIMIKESNFKPDRLPSLEEAGRLIQSKEYQKKKPAEWDKVEPSEKDFYERWGKRLGEEGPFDFDRTLTFHSANHANFLDPSFFFLQKGNAAPYSIADTPRVCSSCLEFFNILGSQWPVKYVVPCIGAVLFGHLPMNQYFRVESVENRKGHSVIQNEIFRGTKDQE
jgi:hypothetical protein